jgi:hypothetical protein
MSLPPLPSGLDPAMRSYLHALSLVLRDRHQAALETQARIDALLTRQVVPAIEMGPPRMQQITVAANTTLQQADMGGLLMVNCTVASNLTLPAPSEGMDTTVCNVGTEVLTLKNDSGTSYSPTLSQGSWTPIRVYQSSAGVPAWPAGIVVLGQNGSIRLTESLTFDLTTEGVVLKSPDGHYWLLTVDNAGAITSTDLGTTIPATT